MRQTFGGLQGREQRKTVQRVKENITGQEQQVQKQIEQYKEQIKGAEQEVESYLKTDAGKIQYAKETGLKGTPIYGRLGRDYATQIMAYKYETPYGEVIDETPRYEAEKMAYKVSKAYDQSPQAQEQYNIRAGLIKEIRAGNIPNVSIEKGLITSSGQPLSISEVGIPQDIYNKLTTGTSFDLQGIGDMTTRMSRTDAQVINADLKKQLSIGGNKDLNTNVSIKNNGFGSITGASISTDISNGNVANVQSSGQPVPRNFFGRVADTFKADIQAKKEVYIPQIGGFASAVQVGPGAKTETISIRGPTIEESKAIELGRLRDIRYTPSTALSFTGQAIADVAGYKSFQDIPVFGEPLWSKDTLVYPTKTITLPSGESALVPASRRISGYDTQGNPVMMGEALPYGAGKYYDKYGEASPLSNVGIISGRRIIPVQEFKREAYEKVKPLEPTINLDTGVYGMERKQGLWRDFAAGAIDLIPETARGFGALTLFPAVAKAVPTAMTTLGFGYGTLGAFQYRTAETPEGREAAAGQVLLGFAPVVIGGAKFLKSKVWDYPAYNVKTGEVVPISDVYIKQEGVTSSKKVTLPSGEKVDVISVRAKTSSGKVEEVFVRAADLQSASESVNTFRFATRGNRPILDILGFEKPSFVGKGVEVKYRTNFGQVEKVAKFSQKQYEKNLKELANKYLKGDVISRDLQKEARIKQAENLARQYLKTTYPQDVISLSRAEALVKAPPESFAFSGVKEDIWMKRDIEVSPTESIKTLVRNPRKSIFDVTGELIKSVPPSGKEIGSLGTKDFFKTYTERRDLWKPLGKQITRETGITQVRLDISKPIGQEGIIQIPGTKIVLEVPSRVSFQRYSEFDVSKDVTFPKLSKSGKISKSESAVNVLSYEPKTEIRYDLLSGKKQYIYKDKIIRKTNLPIKQEMPELFKRANEVGKKSSKEYLDNLYKDTNLPTEEVVTLYTGTSSFSTPKILAEGLKPVGSLKEVYLTPSLESAKGFAARTVYGKGMPKPGEVPKVLEVRIPKSEYDKLSIGRATGKGGVEEVTLKSVPSKYIKEVIETPKLDIKAISRGVVPEGDGLPKMVGGTGLVELPKPAYAPIEETFGRVTAGAGKTFGKLTEPKAFDTIIETPTPIIEELPTRLKVYGTTIKEPEVLSIVKNSLVDKNAEDSSLKLNNVLSLRIDERLDRRLEQKITQKFEDKLDLKLDSKLNLKQEQKLNQRVQQRLSPKVTTTTKLVPNVVKPPRPKPPKQRIGFEDNTLFKRKKLIKGKSGKKSFGSFDVYTKVKGKEVLVASRVTEQAGKDIGVAQTLFGGKKASALSASIILKPVSGPARQVQTRGEFARFGQAFRPGKRDALTLVQKERTNILTGRLGTAQEKRDISLARKSTYKKGGVFKI